MWGSVFIFFYLKVKINVTLIVHEVMLYIIFYSLDIRYQTPLLIRSGITGLEVTYAADEKALFQEITNIIKRYYLVFSVFPPLVFLLQSYPADDIRYKRGQESFPGPWKYILILRGALTFSLLSSFLRPSNKNRKSNLLFLTIKGIKKNTCL